MAKSYTEFLWSCWISERCWLCWVWSKLTRIHAGSCLVWWWLLLGWVWWGGGQYLLLGWVWSGCWHLLLWWWLWLLILGRPWHPRVGFDASTIHVRNKLARDLHQGFSSLKQQQIIYMQQQQLVIFYVVLKWILVGSNSNEYLVTLLSKDIH